MQVVDDLAPQVGLEPTTLRLTGQSSALEYACFQRSREERTDASEPFRRAIRRRIRRRDKHLGSNRTLISIAGS